MAAYDLPTPGTSLAEATALVAGCWVLAPQCGAGELRWQAQKDAVLQAVEGLVDHARGGVDPAGVHVTGLSMGGYAAWTLGMTSPSTFASAVPVCGGMVPDLAKFMNRRALAGMSLYSGFWNTYGVCAGGFEGGGGAGGRMSSQRPTEVLEQVR